MTALVEPIGPETPIAPAGAFPDSVLLASGDYVVTWLKIATTNETMVAVFHSDGTPVGTPVSLSAAVDYHAVASLTSGGFVVVYTTQSQAIAQLFNANGTPAGAAFPLGTIDYYSNSTFDVTGLANGGFAASWRNNNAITVQTFDASGTPVATLTPAFGPISSAPQIAQLASGNMVLTWHEYDLVSPFQGGYPDGYEVSLQLFSPSGIALSPRLTVNQTQVGSHAEPEIVALANGGFAVIWVANGGNAGIFGQVYDAAGTAIGSNFKISDFPGGSQSQPDIAATSWGGFIVTWVDHSYNNPTKTDSGIRAQLFDGHGDALGDIFQASAQILSSDRSPTIVTLLNGKARIFYQADGNADPSGLLVRTIALPIAGTDGDDVLNGTDSVDRIAGLGGNDTIDGGAGADLVNGGAGNDVYHVDDPLDVIEESADEGIDMVYADVSFTLGDNVETLVLNGTANLDGTGNDLDNVLWGNSGNNILFGRGGADRMVGNAGADILHGGAGNDSYELDANDTIIELANEGNDSVNSPVSYVLGENVENLTLWGSALSGTGNDLNNVIFGNELSNELVGAGGDDSLHAGAGNDTVDGGAGWDLLVGQGGDDTLIAGAGNDSIGGGSGIDTLTGGADADTFWGTKAELNGDTITDFGLIDTLIISDATSADFTYSLNGNVLTYTGGSLTLSTPVTGTILARDLLGGAIELRISTHDPDNDFNGDGRSDVLWRNTQSGDVTNWLGQWSGGGFAGNTEFAYNNASANWQIVGTGDFNGDHRDDVLWRSADGIITNWLGNANGGFTGNIANAENRVDAAWQVAGVGDFNGDGREDILWRNTQSGDVTNWLGQSTGSFAGNTQFAYNNASLAWQIVGVGDFNRDGRDDILWRSNDGIITNWLGNANGGFTGNIANAENRVDAAWQVAGIGDFNGDGYDDVLWRNTQSGDVTDWLAYNNGSFAGNTQYAYNNANLAWQIVGVGDYNGDGRDDILWRSSDGTITNWLANNNFGFNGNIANAENHVDSPWLVMPDYPW